MGFRNCGAARSCGTTPLLKSTLKTPHNHFIFMREGQRLNTRQPLLVFPRGPKYTDYIPPGGVGRARTPFRNRIPNQATPRKNTPQSQSPRLFRLTRFPPAIVKSLLRQLGHTHGQKRVELASCDGQCACGRGRVFLIAITFTN